MEDGKFIYVENWPCPDNIRGPYLNGKEIIFYNDLEKVMLIFTYFPLHALQPHEKNSSILVEELKSLVIDNVDFTKNPEIEYSLDLNEIMKHNTLTTRYSKNSNEIFKLVRIYDEYRWEFIDRNYE
jgi:hypothetical protein